MQEECKDSQQLQELQELLPEFISQRCSPMESNPCSADSSSQPGPLAWIVPCNSRAAVPGLGISCSEHREDGSASAQLWEAGMSLSSLAVCSALHSPQEALPSLDVTVMRLLGPCGSPGKEMNLGEAVITSVRLIN